MPPKKKKSLPLGGSSTQSGKRTADSPLPELAKRQKVAEDVGPNGKMDPYCWICHQLEKDIGCRSCQRGFHSDCLKKNSLDFSAGQCPECQLSNKNQSKFLTVEVLKDCLLAAASEFRKKCHNKKDKDVFFQVPIREEGDNGKVIVRRIDFDFIEENIKDEPYKSVSAIISDVKWIHHNFCIVSGVRSAEAREGSNFVRAFLKLMSDIEDCPKCYYNMIVNRKDDLFTNICDPPHDLVWAWIKGSPPWPAKCLRVVNGMAHVRFFGTHDKANVEIGGKKCLAMSKYHPSHREIEIRNVDHADLKRKGYKIATQELLDYINKYERKFVKMKYAVTGTPYVVDPNSRNLLKPGYKPSRKRIPQALVPPSSTHDTNGDERVSNDTNGKSSSDDTNGKSSSNDTNGQSALDVTNDESTLIDTNGGNVLEDTNDESVLDSPIGNQSCTSIQIEAVTSQQPEKQPVNAFLANKNTENTRIQSLANEDPETIQIASSSRVSSATLVCEIASSDENQTIDTNRNFQASAGQIRANFLPRASCSYTPRGISNYNNQVASYRPPLMSNNNRPHLMSNNNRQEQFLSAESQQLHSVDDLEDPIFNNPTLETGNEEDEVIILSTTNFQNNSDNSQLLPQMMRHFPTLGSLCAQQRKLMDTFLIRFWAEASKMPAAPDIIRRCMQEVQELNSENATLRNEVEELTRNATHLNEIIQENENLKKQVSNVQNQLDTNVINSHRILSNMHAKFKAKFQGNNLNELEEKDKEIQEKDVELHRMRLQLREANKTHQLQPIEIKEAHQQQLREAKEAHQQQLREAKEAHQQQLKKANETYQLQLKEANQELQVKRKALRKKDEIYNSLKTSHDSLKAKYKGKETSEQPVAVHDHTSGSSKKSSRNLEDHHQGQTSFETRATDNQICQQTINQNPIVVLQRSSDYSKKSSEKSEDHHSRQAPLETGATNLMCQQTINQETHTIAKKTSLIQLEHSTTITNTRSEGNLVFVPVNPAYGLSQHISRQERYHMPPHSASSFLPTPHGSDRHPKDSKKKQSRRSHHDKT